MSRLAIFFIVTVTVGIQKNAVGRHVQEIDLDKLIDLVNQNRINPQESESIDSDDSDDSDSSDELTRSGRVGDDELLNIITQAINSKKLKQLSKDRKVYKPNREERVQNYENKNNKYDGNSRQSSSAVAQLLEQLLNKRLDDVDFKRQPRSNSLKKTLVPNRLLGTAKKRSPDELDEYSKIYILLNPEAMQKSKSSKSSINKMISSILSMSSSAKREEQLKPKQRYKGFALRPEIDRRRGREERDLYAPKDSSDDKPSRSRGSAGGSGGGHTAIPYIRHRGENIYERE